jgi:hypothetical protein
MKFSHNTAVMQMCVINFLSSLPGLVSFILVLAVEK